MNWEPLRQSIRGTVVTRESSAFASATGALVWNALKPDRAPDVIVTVQDDDDVVTAINFARENGLRVVLHGGGHTWCGLAVRSGGMTIDLSALTQSTIDPATRTAVIQPVISNRELARRLGEHGLAFPIGHCPTVKAGGYLLNGGMSWNLSAWGPACQSITAIEFVTAAGEKITASAASHPDLFWTARGCGPGMFAVATRFHLSCQPLPRAITTSTYFYSLDDLRAVVEEVTRLGWLMPAFVELSVFLIQAPPALADQCRAHNGKLCMIAAVAFADTAAESRSALAVLESGALPQKSLAKSLYESSSFAQLSDISGATWPENHRNFCENQCSKAPPVDILLALRDKFVAAPSPKSVVVFCQSTGGRNLLVPDPGVALSMDASSYGGLWTIWEKPADDLANKQWHDEMAALLKPFSNGHYIGETDIVQDNTRVQESYSAEKWRRLERIRAQYDPTGLFFGFLGGTPPSK